MTKLDRCAELADELFFEIIERDRRAIPRDLVAQKLDNLRASIRALSTTEPSAPVAVKQHVKALDAFERLLSYGRRPEGAGTTFRFDGGGAFFLSDLDANAIRSALAIPAEHLAGGGGVEELREDARMALMYLDTGFIGCDVCGHEMPTNTLDATYTLREALSRPSPALPAAGEVECHGLDTPDRVCFYEQDYYVLSNFSSFNVTWGGHWIFPTSEHCYHWLKFATGAANGKLGGETVSEASQAIAKAILAAASAHEAFKIAERNKHLRRPDWDDVKVEFMRKIVRAKALQHEYVKRKLLATGDRELVENSWRDDFWGWGPNRDGQNMLGKLWMELRAVLRNDGGE